MLGKIIYSEVSKKLFMIEGYSKCDTTDNVSNFTYSLMLSAGSFIKLAKCSIHDVNSYLILKSSRYKNMRVFYCNSKRKVTGCEEISTSMEDFVHDVNTIF